MADERSEDARASGLLHLAFGGETVELPVLRIRKAREWKKRLADLDLSGDGDMDYPVEAMLDLLIAYDVQGLLGDREAIEGKATDQELYDAFQEVLLATFPFVKDANLMTTDDFARIVVTVLLERANSTNGRLQPGTSPRKPSKSRSRKSSSSSSGPRLASA